MEIAIQIKELQNNVWDKILSVSKDNIEIKTMIEIYHYKDTLNQYYVCLDGFQTEFKEEDTEATFERNESSTPMSRMKNEISNFMGTYLFLAKGLKDPFKLFIMGQGNYGKSTLINSLLATGQKHATEGILPVTWKIDVFSNRTDNMVEILKKSGEYTFLSQEEAEGLIKNEDKKIKDQKKQIKERMKVFKNKNNPTKVETVEYEKKLNREDMQYSDIIEVHWPVNNSSILRKFSIVDTPGLNQYNSSGELMNSAQDYFHKSDGVLWLLDAVAISSGGSAKMIEELNDSLAKFGNKRKATDSIIAVLNRIDLVANSEEDVKKVIKSAQEIYGNVFKTIIPYSAKQAYESVEQNDKQLESQSGKVDLLNEIDRKFFRNSKKIQCDKKITDCYSYNQIVIEKIKKFNKNILVEREIAFNNAESIEGHFDKEVADLEQEFDIGLRKIYAAFDANLISNLEELSGSKKESKQAMINKTFRVDNLHHLFNQHVESAKKRLNTEAKMLLKYKITTQYESLRKFMQIKDINININATFDIQLDDADMPNVAASAATTALGAGLLFGPIGAVIGGGLAAVFSSVGRESVRIKFEEEMKKILEGLKEQYNEALSKVIQKTEEEVKVQIQMSFCSLYNIHLTKYDPIMIKNHTNNLIDKGNEAINSLSEKVSITPSLMEIIAFC